MAPLCTPGNPITRATRTPPLTHTRGGVRSIRSTGHTAGSDRNERTSECHLSPTIRTETARRRGKGRVPFTEPLVVQRGRVNAPSRKAPQLVHRLADRRRRAGRYPPGARSTLDATASSRSRGSSIPGSECPRSIARPDATRFHLAQQTSAAVPPRTEGVSTTRSEATDAGGRPAVDELARTRRDTVAPAPRFTQSPSPTPPPAATGVSPNSGQRQRHLCRSFGRCPLCGSSVIPRRR